MSYKYRVEFAHVNDNIPEGEPLRQGTGTVEIETDLPVETQEEKDEVAKSLARKIGETRTVTAVAVLAIIPLERGEVVVDYDELD